MGIIYILSIDVHFSINLQLTLTLDTLDGLSVDNALGELGGAVNVLLVLLAAVGGQVVEVAGNESDIVVADVTHEDEDHVGGIVETLTENLHCTVGCEGIDLLLRGNDDEALILGVDGTVAGLRESHLGIIDHQFD